MPDKSRLTETNTLAASLGQWLSQVKLDKPTKKEITAEVTKQTTKWAQSQGWSVQLEVLSRAIRTLPNGNKYRGYLDMVCSRPGRPPIAIEIDRSNKNWSVEKLTGEVEAGSIALWVRWRGVMIDVPDTIGLVNVAPATPIATPTIPLVSAKQASFMTALAQRVTLRQFDEMLAEVIQDSDVPPRRHGEQVIIAVGRLNQRQAQWLIGKLRKAERRPRRRQS